jgi:hypothetical protein
MTIEGRAVRVIERAPPLPPTLELLLEGGRDREGRPWSPLRVAARRPAHLGGSSRGCVNHDHRLSDWLAGFHTGSDAIVRSLRLLLCDDCGAVCVRDQSFDTLPGLSPGRQALRRRDLIIGWYLGARPRQRQYT